MNVDRRKRKLRKYRVFVRQVNQACVTIRAANMDDALDKGYRKWKRECAHSEVSYVEEIK